MAAAAIPAIIAGASAIAGGVSKSDAADARAQALRLEEEQMRQQAGQEQIQRAQKEAWVIGEQKARAAARGESEASGSFGAEVLGSATAYTTDSDIAKTNLQWRLKAMDNQIDAYQTQASDSMFQSLLGAAGSMASLIPMGGGPGAAAASGLGSTSDAYKSIAQAGTEIGKQYAEGANLDGQIADKQYGAYY